VGWQRRLVVGKHSGRHLVSNVLQQNGITLSKEEIATVLEGVRNLSVKFKRSLTVEELLNLVPERRVAHGIS
jgi:homocitrate synthase NifV